jgi:hypothetical protein
MPFAHLKRILTLDRLRLRGPKGAHDEFLFAANTHKRSPQSDWVPPAQFDLEVLFSFPVHAEQSVGDSGRGQVERFRVMPPFFRNVSRYLHRSAMEYLHQTRALRPEQADGTGHSRQPRPIRKLLPYDGSGFRHMMGHRSGEDWPADYRDKLRGKYRNASQIHQ